MSKIHLNQPSTTFASVLMQKLSETRVAQGAKLSADVGKGVASLESASPEMATRIQGLASALNSGFVKGIEDAAKASCGVDAAGAAELAAKWSGHSAGLEAAAIVSMAAGSGSKGLKASYLTQLRNSVDGGNVDANDQGRLANQPYAQAFALESFAEAEVDNHTDMSVSYNFSATQQDEFSALFYPIIVGTPDQVYWRVTARRPSVTYGAQHAANGEKTAYVKVNLLDAYRDHTILENEDTRVVPYLNPDNTQDKYFLGAEFDETFTVRQIAVPTRPLKFGEEIADSIDFKGLSSHPDLIKAGLMTQIDKLDTGAKLQELIIKISDGTDTSYITVPTERMQYSQFNTVREGLTERGELRFRNNDFTIDTAQIKDHKNQPIPALTAAAAANLNLVLQLRVDGDLHLETGELTMSTGKNKLLKVLDGSGAETTSPAVANLVIEVVGFKLNARWLNVGRRVISMMLDSDELVRNYYIPTLAPISLQRPVTEETQNADTEDLITATHARMSNMAVTSLFQHKEQLKYLYNEAVREATNGRTPDWRGLDSYYGVGALFMAAFYEEVEVDLQKVVNSISSADKMADVRGFFAGLINEMAYRMVTLSGYLPALRSYTGDQKAKPKLLIGTDIYLPAFMFIAGDDRLAGAELSYEIAQSYDNRMAGKIFLSLAGVSRSNTMNILGHGNMLYIPELVATVPMLRNGNTTKETMVQPRFRFIEHIPVMSVITVTNVKAVMAQRTKLDVNQYTVTP